MTTATLRLVVPSAPDQPMGHLTMKQTQCFYVSLWAVTQVLARVVMPAMMLAEMLYLAG